MNQVCRYGDAYSFPFQRVSFESAHEYNAAGTQVATTYDFVITGFLYAEPSAGQQTLAGAINLMEYWLNRPRQSLKLSWTPGGGSEEVLYYFGDEGGGGNEALRDPDVEWGPLPQGLRVREITGGLAAEYEWRVRCKTKRILNSTDGDRINQARSRILAVTRAFSFHIDEDGLTTRRVSGRLTVDRQSISTNRGPSYYLDYVTPNLPDGFQRFQQTHDVDETGLSMTFTIVDRERANTLPAPITSGNAVMSVNSPFLGGRVRFTLYGSFGAPKDVPKAKVLGIIFSLLVSRMGRRSILEDREVTTDLFSNTVTFRFTWWETNIAPLGKFTTQQAVGPLLEKVPGSDGKGQMIGPYGTAGLTENILKQPYDSAVNKLGSLKRDLSKSSGDVAGTQRSELAKSPLGTIAEAPSDVAAIFDTTPIVNFYHRRDYLVDPRTAMFWPKTYGSDPVDQQTGPARIFVIDAGVVRYLTNAQEKQPPIPSPPSADTHVLVQPAIVSATAPEPYGDGSYMEVSVKWCYVFARRKTPKGTSFDSVGAEVPADIRRRSSKPFDLKQKLDGLLPDGRDG